MILGLETSCDDTCAAVVDREGRVRSNVISSQGVHDRFGGVVPEIASRHHLQAANVVVDAALSAAGVGWEQVDTVAVTQGPGLIGALLVGLSCAKGLAAARRLPLVPVDHLQGHVSANFLRPGPLDPPLDPSVDPPSDALGREPDPLEPPFLCLVASGGHTFLAHVRDHSGYEVLGQTLDDAAGEAVDKGARLLGLPFPGGPALERLAAGGDPEAFALPQGRTSRAGRSRPFDRSLDFSFAGLKTALLYLVRDLGEAETARRSADLAASYQHAIVEALAARAERGLEQTGLDKLALGGGVAANQVLRARLAGLGAALHVPPPELCTDNAAMIAGAARFETALAYPHYLGLDAYPTGASRPLTAAAAG